MKDNSLNDKLNLYFEKNSTLDKNMIIRSLENLIEGKTLNTDDYKLLKSTGFFDIVYQLKTNTDTTINEVDLFKIRSKITKLYDIITENKELNINDYNKLFDKDYNNSYEKKQKLDFDQYNDLITNKIFEICENKISKNKGKFDYSQEILNYLDKLIDENTINSESVIESTEEINLNNNYLKKSSNRQINDILNELNMDKDLININNQDEIELLQSVYQDSENIYFNNDSDNKTNSDKDSIKTNSDKDSIKTNSDKDSIKTNSDNKYSIKLNSDIKEIKDKFSSMFENYNESSNSINFLIDNSKNLENNLVTLVSRLNKLEENNRDQNSKITILEKSRQNKSKIDYDFIFNDIEKTLREFKGSIGQIENKNNVNDKEIEILKNRISILDSDLSKHKECVVNSFEIIEERLTQLFKSMIVVNNNIKHCYANTEKMYTEINSKIR